MNRTFAAVALLAASALSAGCITLYSKTEVLRGDERRLPVRYENVKAAEIFRKGMSQRPDDKGGTSVGVPFVTIFRRHKMLSPDAFFNEQVRCCDADQNGEITEQEAHIYAGEWSGPPPGWDRPRLPAISMPPASPTE